MVVVVVIVVVFLVVAVVVHLAATEEVAEVLEEVSHTVLDLLILRTSQRTSAS